MEALPERLISLILFRSLILLDVTEKNSGAADLPYNYNKVIIKRLLLSTKFNIRIQMSEHEVHRRLHT
jgi:hypothetical protein